MVLNRYEEEGLGRRTVKAQDLWFAIVNAQIETGTPFMLYKDHCNAKSNQQHLGTIHCSNLCTEIIEYTAPNEVNTRREFFPLDGRRSSPSGRCL